MESEPYQFLGLHLMWWSILGIILFVIFVVPSYLQRQRSKEITARDRQTQQFTSGQVNKSKLRVRKKKL